MQAIFSIGSDVVILVLHEALLLAIRIAARALVARQPLTHSLNERVGRVFVRLTLLGHLRLLILLLNEENLAGISH